MEIMSIVAVVAMVALLSIIKHLRHVLHDMWVKMTDMESETDRLRRLLGPNTVTIGCLVKFESQQYVKGGKEYVDYLVDVACDSMGRYISKELACYIRPMVVEGMHRGKSICAGEMHFRMPMVRSDFKAMTCYMTDMFCQGRTIPIVSEIDHRREILKEQFEVGHFKDVLDSLHVDTNVFSKP